VNIIYVEEEIRDYPRTQAILARFPHATVIPIERYGEVFNRRAQSFRLQKKSPSLILAKKYGELVLPAPKGYGIGANHNYYFSHMMNCVYDCRYCFLQGMYRSAHYVVFVNFEDFFSDIRAVSEGLNSEEVHFFSGYDCDSLAYEPVTHFVEEILPLFESLPNASLELRSKSTQVRGLLEREPLENVIPAFSLAPQELIESWEHKTPGLEARLAAMQKLCNQGWKLGLRFDPVLYHPDYRTLYKKFYEQVFQTIPLKALHSVSLGPFRLPEGFYQNMTRLYPDEGLLAGPLQKTGKMVSYKQDLEEELVDYCERSLLEYIPEQVYFPCKLEAS